MNAPRNLRGYVPGLPSFVCFRFMEDWFRRRQGLFSKVFDPEYNINDILPQPKCSSYGLRDIAYCLIFSRGRIKSATPTVLGVILTELLLQLQGQDFFIALAHAFLLYFILVQITPPPVPYSNSFLSVSDAPPPAAFGQLKEEARKDIFEGSLSLSRLKGSTRLTPRELPILHSPPNLFTSLTKSFALFVLLIILARAPLTLFERLRSSPQQENEKVFAFHRAKKYSVLSFSQPNPFKQRYGIEDCSPKDRKDMRVRSEQVPPGVFISQQAYQTGSNSRNEQSERLTKVRDLFQIFLRAFKAIRKVKTIPRGTKKIRSFLESSQSIFTIFRRMPHFRSAHSRKHQARHSIVAKDSFSYSDSFPFLDSRRLSSSIIRGQVLSYRIEVRPSH